MIEITPIFVLGSPGGRGKDKMICGYPGAVPTFFPGEGLATSAE